MKNLKFPLLFTIAALAFGFLPTEAKAQYHRGNHCDQVIRYYDNCDGWRYKVVRYYDHGCRLWRERHVRVSRCRPPIKSYRGHGSPHRYRSDYRQPSYTPRSRYPNHRIVNIGGVRYTVDSRRGLNRTCR